LATTAAKSKKRPSVWRGEKREPEGAGGNLENSNLLPGNGTP